MSKVKDALCIEYGEYDVSVDRDKYIGGSDIPVILGISSFKTRWQLLLEKAGLEENTFRGNVFTEYGHNMEPCIRHHVNLQYNTNFVPSRVIDGDIRCHTDGLNGKCVLEVKTTSTIYAKAEDYKVYLCQLVKYMEETQVEDGILAVYERPEDLSLSFDAQRLQVFEIRLDDYRELLNTVNREINRFREDLKRLKENPLLSEQDFLPPGNLVALADKVARFESQLAALKEIELKCKEAKKQLYNEMLKRDVKSWAMPNGTKITRVDSTPSTEKIVREFDTERFTTEHPETAEQYMKETVKKTGGRAGYVKITLPKG